MFFRLSSGSPGGIASSLLVHLGRLLLIDHTAGQSGLHNGLGQILHGTGREASVERVGHIAGIAAGVDRGGHVPDGRRLIHLDDEALAVGQPDLDGRGGLRLVDRGGRGGPVGGDDPSLRGGRAGTSQAGALPLKGGKSTTTASSASTSATIIFSALVDQPDHDVALNGLAVLVQPHLLRRPPGGEGAEELAVGRIVQTAEGAVVDREAIAVHGDAAADGVGTGGARSSAGRGGVDGAGADGAKQSAGAGGGGASLHVWVGLDGETTESMMLGYV